MKQIVFILCLLIPALSFAQFGLGFPNRGLTELGKQTSARGLTYLGSGMPNTVVKWRVAKDTACYTWIDTLTSLEYKWNHAGDYWATQGIVSKSTPPLATQSSGPATVDNREAFWQSTSSNVIHGYDRNQSAWMPLHVLRLSAAPSNISSSGSQGAAIYTGGLWKSTVDDSMRHYIAGSWRVISGGGASYTAGTGIGITGTVISNTGDLSNTNELQTIDTFSVSGSVVSLSLSQDNQPAKTITLPASGITILTGDVTATGPGSAVATIAAGAVTGAKLAANSVDSTKITPLSIPNSDIANVAPEKLLQKGATTGQVLGWNGSVWGPTAAGISGSGTTGFLPKFSSSTGLTNSAFDENAAGYITSTTRGITVGDAVSSSAAGSGFRLLRGTLNGGYFSNGNQLIFQTTSNHDLYFSTNATERMRILAGGNVGIGVSPAARLHVQGAGATSSTWTAQFHNSTGNNNALMVRDDGFVGVGTNAPTDRLDINGANGYSQLRLRTTYTPTSSADALGNVGDIAHDANYFYVKTAAGWKRAALSTF